MAGILSKAFRTYYKLLQLFKFNAEENLNYFLNFFLLETLHGSLARHFNSFGCLHGVPSEQAWQAKSSPVLKIFQIFRNWSEYRAF